MWETLRRRGLQMLDLRQTATFERTEAEQGRALISGRRPISVEHSATMRYTELSPDRFKDFWR
jgi:hypothetical protein